MDDFERAMRRFDEQRDHHGQRAADGFKRRLGSNDLFQRNRNFGSKHAIGWHGRMVGFEWAKHGFEPI